MRSTIALILLFSLSACSQETGVASLFSQPRPSQNLTICEIVNQPISQAQFDQIAIERLRIEALGGPEALQIYDASRQDWSDVREAVLRWCALYGDERAQRRVKLLD